MKYNYDMNNMIDKGNSSIPLFKSHKSTERKQIMFTNQNRVTHRPQERKTTKQQ